MVALVTCKNEEDNPIKNEGARVATRLFVNFSDVQGQIYVTPYPANKNVSEYSGLVV